MKTGKSTRQLPQFFSDFTYVHKISLQLAKNELKIGSTIMTISHDDITSAEKSLFWNWIVSQFIKRPPQMRNEVLFPKYRDFLFYFKIFINLQPPEVEKLLENKIKKNKSKTIL